LNLALVLDFDMEVRGKVIIIGVLLNLTMNWMLEVWCYT